jgi:hypothetical protein
MMPTCGAKPRAFRFSFVAMALRLSKASRDGGDYRSWHPLGKLSRCHLNAALTWLAS